MKLYHEIALSYEASTYCTLHLPQALGFGNGWTPAVNIRGGAVFMCAFWLQYYFAADLPDAQTFDVVSRHFRQL